MATDNLQEQYDQLRAETNRIALQLRDDETQLVSACAERDAIAIDMVRGKRSASDGTKIQARITELEMRISGARQIIDSNTVQLREWNGELQRRAHAENRAQRLAELDALTAEGKQRVERIIEKLADLMLTELPALDRVRFRLVKEFFDLHGQSAYEELGRTFDQLLGERVKNLHVLNGGVSLEMRSFVRPN